MGLILDAITGIAGAVNAWKNNQIAEETADRNYELQLQTMEYNKEMQQKAWEREDNAVQRRVSDLVNAGLSPTLAAGSAASSSSPIKLDAPQKEAWQRQSLVSAALGAASGFEGLMQQKANVSRTVAEEKLLGEKLKNERLNNSILAQTAQSQINMQNLKYEAAKLLHNENLSDHEKLRELGFLYGAKNSDIVNFVDALGGTKQALQWFKDNIGFQSLGNVLGNALTDATGSLNQAVNDMRQQVNQQVNGFVNEFESAFKDPVGTYKNKIKNHQLKVHNGHGGSKSRSF